MKTWQTTHSSGLERNKRWAIRCLQAYYGVSLMGNSLNPLKALRPIPRGEDLIRFQRKTEPKGPLAVFGYDYLEDHAKAAGVATPKLLNYADGKRSAQEIRDAVSAEYGPVPLELVLEYLRALVKIGVLEQVK